MPLIAAGASDARRAVEATADARSASLRPDRTGPAGPVRRLEPVVGGEVALRPKGKRFFLSKVREEQDSELLQSLQRRQYINEKDEAKFLVFFKIDKELPLIGAGN